MIFKTVVLAWKCLHDAVPRHLAHRPLCAGGVYGRSSSVSLCSLRGPPGAWTRTFTDQPSFAAYGLRTWNRLPTALRLPELSLASFKRQLKTHLSVPALDSAGCSCGCRVLSSHRRCCDCTASSAPTRNVQTRLEMKSTGLYLDVSCRVDEYVGRSQIAVQYRRWTD